MKRLAHNVMAVLSLPLIACSTSGGPELVRPVILVDAGDRAAILERIANYEEMQEAYSAWKTWADEQVATHKQDPSATDGN